MSIEPHFLFSLYRYSKEASRYYALLDRIRRKPLSRARSELVPYFGWSTSIEPVNVHINIARASFDQVGNASIGKGPHQIFYITSIGINGFGPFLPFRLRLNKSTGNGILGHMRVELPLDLLHVASPPLSLYRVVSILSPPSYVYLCNLKRRNLGMRIDRELTYREKELAD
jgi:hypothetical protein